VAGLALPVAAFAFSATVLGAVEVWAQAILALAALAGLGLLAAAGRLRDDGSPRAPGPAPEAFLAALLGLGLLQIVPLPPGLHRLLSPEAAGWLDRGLAPGDEGRWRTLSLCPWATRVEVLRFATLGIVYALFARGIRRGGEARGALAGLVAVGTGAAVVSVLDVASGGALLGWYPREARYPGRLAGVLVNPNHFAGTMEMIVLAALGLAFARAARLHDAGEEGLPGTLVRGFRSGTNRPAAAALLVAVFLGTTALVLTGSRLGVFSFLAGLAALALALSRGERRGRALLGLAAVVAVLLAVNAALSLDPLLERGTVFGGGGTVPGRVRAFRAVAAMGARFPVLGSGLGTFEHVFPAYQPADLGGTWDRAHNDYLQLFCDGGLIGAALAAGFAACWLRPVLRAATAGPGPRRGAAAGVLAAAVALAAHSTGDFCLQIPGNGFLLAALLGLGFDAATRPLPGEAP
jgi:O-antigen ligase